MNNCKKTIKLSDITTTPIKLKYSSSYGVDDFSSYGITTVRGVNSAITITGSVKQSTLNYALIKHLYYNGYLTGSVNFSSSYWNSNDQSTACSGSSDYENRYFPTQSEEVVGILTIPNSVFGEQVSRKTFVIKPKYGSNYNIYDDGNGNLIDSVASKHVGNIIYSQGIAIITNSEYSRAFSQVRTVIGIINNANGIRLNTLTIDGGGVTYTGGTFPVLPLSSTSIFPDSNNFPDVQGQFYVTSNGSYCVRSRHTQRDENNNIINTYLDSATITIPRVSPPISSAPVTFNSDLNFAGTINEYSSLEYTISNGSCT